MEYAPRKPILSVLIPQPTRDKVLTRDAEHRLAEFAEDGALLINTAINTARAGIIDQEALPRQLRSGRISAALDVFETEPLPDHSELRRLTNVTLFPHAAGCTVDSYRRQGVAMVAEVERFLRGRPSMFEIDPDRMSVIA